MDLLFQTYLFFSTCALLVFADPQFCTRGFQLASRFHVCWEQATFSNKYPPLYEPHEYLDGKFMEAYATHMCSVVKPQALKCLERDVKECSNLKKVMAIADKSGGACEGYHLNPFFKKHVIDNLVAVKGDSPCFELGDHTYKCYTAAAQKVMQSRGQSDDIVTFHKVADRFFNAYWECMVQIYKTNIKVCPHWQIPMLLTLQKTAMPSLFGLRLQPEQVRKLELNMNDKSGGEEDLKVGPSSLYLLIQLHKTIPEVNENQEDSVVLELSDLNEENPHINLESEEGMVKTEPKVNLHEFTLKEIKKLLREQRRRNKELKEFINQVKGTVKGRPMKGKKEETKSKKANTRKRLHQDSMVA